MSDDNAAHRAGVRAFRLYDLVTATGGRISYEEAQEELGLTDEQMREAFLIMREAMRERRRRRNRCAHRIRDAQARQAIRSRLEEALELV